MLRKTIPKTEVDNCQIGLFGGISRSDKTRFDCTEIDRAGTNKNKETEAEQLNS